MPAFSAVRFVTSIISPGATPAIRFNAHSGFESTISAIPTDQNIAPDVVAVMRARGRDLRTVHVAVACSALVPEYLCRDYLERQQTIVRVRLRTAPSG